MPSWPATRRASSAASSEQQLFLNSEYESATSCRRIHTPTTSWPWRWSSAAATDESTPPDIATRTRLMRRRTSGARRRRALASPPRRPVRSRAWPLRPPPRREARASCREPLPERVGGHREGANAHGGDHARNDGTGLGDL